jgi:hypothetical protein
MSLGGDACRFRAVGTDEPLASYPPSSMSGSAARGSPADESPGMPGPRWPSEFVDPKQPMINSPK